MSTNSNKGRVVSSVSRTVLIAGVTAVTVGGVATAAIPSADGTIYGCYSKQSGALRIVEEGSMCDPYLNPENPGEAAIHWNQQGPAGAAGAQGPQGAQGEPGQQRTAGSSMNQQIPNSAVSEQLEADLRPTVSSQFKNVDFKIGPEYAKPVVTQLEEMVEVPTPGAGPPPPLMKIEVPKGNWSIEAFQWFYSDVDKWTVSCTLLPGKGVNSASVTGSANSLGGPGTGDIYLHVTLEAKQKFQAALYCQSDQEGVFAGPSTGCTGFCGWNPALLRADPLPPKS